MFKVAPGKYHLSLTLTDDPRVTGASIFTAGRVRALKMIVCGQAGAGEEGCAWTAAPWQTTPGNSPRIMEENVIEL